MLSDFLQIKRHDNASTTTVLENYYLTSDPFSTSKDAVLPEKLKQHDTEYTCHRPLGPMGKILIYRKETGYPGLDVLRFP